MEKAPSIDSIEEFVRVLKLGFGRAILFIHARDVTPYRDAILDACLHYDGYDWQIDGLRTTYLYDLLQATGDAESFIAPILTALRDVTAARDADQLIHLVSYFAEDGHAGARTALYEKIDRNDTEEPFLRCSTLIYVDGLAGFLHAADLMGAALLDDPTACDDLHWGVWNAVTDAEEIEGRAGGKERVRQTLAEAARENPRIRAYAEALAAYEAKRAASSHDRPRWGTISYEQIRQAIFGEGSLKASIGGLGTWGRDVSDADVNRAAADLLAEDDEERLVRYLQLFQKRPFPLQIDRLLELVRHPNDDVMLAVTGALSNVADPRVRALALEILADDTIRTWWKSRGVGLLGANYEPGDEILLARLLETPRDEDEYHWIGHGALEIFETHPTPKAVPALLALYEHGPCTQCRERIVELLEQLGRLPGWLLKECHYDANLGVRETAEEICRNRGGSH